MLFFVFIENTASPNLWFCLKQVLHSLDAMFSYKSVNHT